MKNISALLVVVVLAAAGPRAAAQESMWGRSPAEPLPPNRFGDGQEMLPSRQAFDALAPPVDATADAVLEPSPETLPPGNGAEGIEGGPTGEEFGGSILGEPMKALEACNPLYFESTGTWLRRGYWYAEADFLLLNRGWDRKGLSLASEGDVATIFPGVNAGQFLISNELRIRGERPGGEGVGRVKLGRFLFRDAYNRDHLAEVGWYGGGEWLQEASLDAATEDGLNVTDFIDRVNSSFDGARSMNFRHESEMNTAEINYLVKQRMHRDQMVMQPSGEWVRKATPSRTVTFLAGARYMNLREMLNFNATDVTVRTTPTPALQEDGFYFIETDNNLFGTQLGVGAAHETARWSIGAMAKAGAYINRIDLNSQFQVGETVITNSGETNAEEDDLSFIGEAQLLAKWHLRPNVSLRVGLELLFVDSIALAPHQLNFIPGGYDQIAASGDSVFLGTSFGVESHW